VVELRGDEALCVFDSPRQALRTAVSLQHRFADAMREDPSLPLRVGIGLDAGEAVSVEGGFRGGALNMAARLSALARAGDVLAGDGIVLTAGQVEGLSYTDRGRVRVKGFQDPVRVHRLEFELDLPPAPPAARSGRVPVSRLWLAGAGALALAAAATVTTLLVLRDGGEAGGVAADSAALLDPSSGRVVREFPVGATPLAVVSDDSAAWTLDADAQTISRVPSSGGQVLTKAPGVTATGLALGEGLLWASYVDRTENGERAGVASLDPSTLTLRGHHLLPGVGPDYGEDPTILTANGALWISGPDDLLRKVNPVSLSIEDSARLGTPVLGLASGLGSIWATVGRGVVKRIDPRTLEVTKLTTLSTPEAGPIAVGASSLWVADTLAGHVWRIEPGPPVETHTISAGHAAAGIAFGDGAVWVANPIEGRVVRIDAKTEDVREFELGNAPVAVSVAPAGVWAAVVAGGGRSIAPAPKLEGLDTLAAGTCQTAVYGGSGRPDLLIVSDLPMQRFDAPVTLAMVQAIEFVLRRHDFRAGPYDVAFQACDDATVPAASYTEAKCAANTKRYVATPSVIAVIGPFNSGCAEVQIPIANRAEPGPLPIVSPTASFLGLTRNGAGVARGNLGRLYPTGIRNFVRVYPADDVQGAADAVLAQRLGVRRAYVFVTDPNDAYGAGLGDAFATAGRKLGMRVEKSSPRSRDRFASLAEDLRRSGVDGVFLAGLETDGAVDFIRAIRRALGRELVIIAPDSFLPVSDQVPQVGPAAVGMYVSGGGVTEPERQLPPEGRRFTKAFSATQRGRNVNLFAPYAAQATEVLLDAISRSDGTRASVARELFRVRLEDSIFGPFSFDRNGDPNANLLPIFRVPARAPTGRFPVDHVYTVIPVPARLVR
jgi:branched-chain amino acid transport system substrate-binding protein